MIPVDAGFAERLNALYLKHEMPRALHRGGLTGKGAFGKRFACAVGTIRG